ncbi:Utp14 protein-domain-containing protein [Chaetomium strumarium]|uniref:Utp14 protein-domain-containing protein n=1 Tax=Chaetomium strumarium TaxID=1170767 RepID=A0AAJ0LZJ3_9PEZI|nr:Utp14 protein-domain-containing protein [Chaetomium strumarium]
MPGRQAHGRPLLPTATAAGGGGGGHNKPSKSHVKHFKKSRAKATANALDAFARAAEQVGDDSPVRGVRRRALDDDDDGGEQHPGKRQRRGEDDDDDEDGDEDLNGGERGKKRPRREQDGEDGFDGFSDDDGAAGSDSEEWHVGVGGEDEDSELDSDEAFGESDEERFEGFGFAGSGSKGGRKKGKRKAGGEAEDSEEQEEEEEDDLESLGSDAIDLATALDQFSEEDDDEEQEESGSEEEDDESTDADDESEEDEDDESKLDALQSMIAGFAGEDEEEGEQQTGSQGKPKLSLKDLGLAGVKDPHIKRALRLMNKEEKAVKPGSSKKLDVPLAKRQQDRLLRSAAYEKTNETLGRWVETVKHNRRADHLVFPLAQNAHDRGLDGAELMPINQKTSGTELEQTILAIMEESGLGPSAKAEKKEEGDGSGQNGLTQAELKEIARQRRRERELHSREMARAKRIKKIKSKTYRRIHRKELAREQEAEHEAALANGELDSEDERELLDRRRALERVGTRHRESKWAKLGKKAGRAVWDENFRAGLTEMAQRKEELRRRIEGRTGGSDDDDDDVSDVSDASEEGDNRHRLLAELDRAAAYDEDEAPQSKLMQMKFMQRGEELRKKENDEAIAELRRQLDSDNEVASDEEMEIGRRQYGMGNSAATANASATAAKRANAADARGPANSTSTFGRPQPTSQSQPARQVEPQSSTSGAGGAWTAGPPPAPAPAAAGVWSQVEPSGRKSKKASKTRAEEVDISGAVTLSIKSSKPKPTSDGTPTVHADGGQDSDDDADLHLPMAIRDQKLIERAFAGEDVHGQFEEEKAEIERDDDEKEIDNTLPGWGSWVGEGVSNREKRRHQGRFITKVEGVKKRDRKDFRLKDVIISEKRIKKNDKYLAPGLPHPFESQQQYERSLRLPVGPEWVTKETFQDATKPRIIVKQGIIAPMSNPMY